ncbi:short-chain dehydrogenase/reductase SDR [Gonapodya prolifera JEL478]|uniref:Short-chain dehydrogenase/reductase SDR n=1 Tax=Gonapodya prolifera (strain JEL478) TaxID=1344416 RepID=A0A139AVN9_GONPJ|nr:short-chain dehydrogenase/reductase SDR [Gonapodya prolifera JEL478]|eukprot:KXS20796.1 short-chain dehydrogenase/reductase SDR [Gonapodya prolifera JEL478]
MAQSNLFSLAGKKGLVVGIANDQSIAWGCAKAFHQMGAELAITYLNEKADRFVRPLAEEVKSSIYVPLDLLKEGELEAVFAQIKEKWGRLDFLVHAVAFAAREDLHGRLVDSSAKGFSLAMDISCHSFVRMAKLAEPLMDKGGSLVTLSKLTYYGSQKVVLNYGLMGPVKAALESVTKYMAAELGQKKIRVNAISAGAIATRAASGISGFSDLQKNYAEKSPYPELSSQDDVGALAAYLVSDVAKTVTGGIHYVDAGFNVVAP